MFEILLATSNAHKVQEMHALLGDFADDVCLKSLKDYPVLAPCVEDGTTFEENAIKKALHGCRAANIVTIADDSGLVVDALDGAPGIYSSRYAGETATDAENVAKLLLAMEGQLNRKAKFVCVLAVVNEGEVLATFTGEVHGVLRDAPAGCGGFGYDPIFVPDGETLTFAELPQERKNQISHRARAVKEALAFFEELSALL